jgi:hypothetical protein
VLTITDTARDVLRKIPKQPDLPGSAGLRIARRETSDRGFHVMAAPHARSGDHVVEDGDARVFLGPVAAERFRGRELDARRDARGRIEFVVREASS